MLRMKPKQLRALQAAAKASPNSSPSPKMVASLDLKSALSKAQDKIERLEWDNKALQLANENMKEAFLALKGEP